jgi:Zn-dependent protease with chaperone function
VTKPSKFALILFGVICLGDLFAIHAKGEQSSTAPTQSSPSAHQQGTAYLDVFVNRYGGSFSEFTFDFPPNREPGLPSALSQTVGCTTADWQPDEDAEQGESTLLAECELSVSRKLLETGGQIDLRKIREVLGREKISQFDVNLSFPKSGFTSCVPAPSELLHDEDDSCFYRFENEPAIADSVRFYFGYRVATLAWSAAILLAVFLLPLPLTFWLRHQALTAPEDAKAAVSFAYMRYQLWGMIGGLILWWTAIDAVNADAVLSYVLKSEYGDGTTISYFLPWFFLWIPPALMYALCNSFSAPIHRLRGSERSQREIIRQSLWSSATMVVPIGFLVASISYFFSSSPRTAVLCLAAWFFLAIFFSGKLRQAHGLEPNALTRGDLRDRAFGIAEKAGVQLDGIYVLPSQKIRIANAFAHSRRTISLTDYLLKNMSKREVDAVIGHEIAHLQLHHIRTRLIVYFTGLALFGFATSWFNDFVSPRFPTGPICLIFLLLAMYYVSRRNEFAADRGSVRLTGDFEAMITALAKLARLNTIPLRWSKLNDPMLTHPSMDRRISALASASAVPAERLKQLLQDSSDPPSEAYALPSTVTPTGKVFSTRYKSRSAQRIGWITLFTMTLPLAAVALILRSVGFEGTRKWLVYLGGLVAALAISWVVTDFVSMWNHSQLAARIRQKLKAQGAPEDLCTGLFIGLGPDSSPRIYENNWSWDFGLLALRSDCLLYYGEETTFALQRSQITRIELGPGPATWYRTPNVYIVWKTIDGTESVFNVRPMDATSLTQMGKKTRLMYRDLNAWLLGSNPDARTLVPVSSSASGLGEAPPVSLFGNVTGRAPRFFVTPRMLYRNYLTVGIVAAGIAILCGLHFIPDVDKTSSPVPGMFFDISGWYVVIGSWIVRSIQLWPFRRYHDRKTETHLGKPTETIETASPAS